MCINTISLHDHMGLTFMIVQIFCINLPFKWLSCRCILCQLNIKHLNSWFAFNDTIRNSFDSLLHTIHAFSGLSHYQEYKLIIICLLSFDDLYHNTTSANYLFVDPKWIASHIFNCINIPDEVTRKTIKNFW